VGEIRFLEPCKTRVKLLMSIRPGFSWDRINFHKKLVGLT